ncbi:MAG TPA: enoyl-CoA hydratase/isomerase family protein [bacterium]|nr:enoyl-CoA hydratase/isomerase family protein [bacterium]
MEYKTIMYESRGPVGVLTLSRPECLNAVNQAMSRELRRFLLERLDDLETRVLIMTGAGRGFCAGLDMKETMAEIPPGGYRPKLAYERQRAFSELILLLRRIPQPIIGAVNGAAAGAGFSFALACDVRLAAPEAKFSAAYINIGVGGADMGSSWLFPRAVGTANASRYLMTGDLFDANEALRIGMVQAVLAKDKLMEEAGKMASVMAGKSPLGLRVTKEAINRNTGGMTLEDAILFEDRNQAMCISQLTAPGG